jgi:hypothetical protein
LVLRSISLVLGSGHVGVGDFPAVASLTSTQPLAPLPPIRGALLPLRPAGFLLPRPSTSTCRWQQRRGRLSLEPVPHRFTQEVVHRLALLTAGGDHRPHPLTKLPASLAACPFRETISVECSAPKLRRCPPGPASASKPFGETRPPGGPFPRLPPQVLRPGGDPPGNSPRSGGTAQAHGKAGLLQTAHRTRPSSVRLSRKGQNHPRPWGSCEMDYGWCRINELVRHAAQEDADAQALLIEGIRSYLRRLLDRYGLATEATPDFAQQVLSRPGAIIASSGIVSRSSAGGLMGFCKVKWSRFAALLDRRG